MKKCAYNRDEALRLVDENTSRSDRPTSDPALVDQLTAAVAEIDRVTKQRDAYAEMHRSAEFSYSMAAKERDDLKAQLGTIWQADVWSGIVEEMRPVVAAAEKWRDAVTWDAVIELGIGLRDAIDAYRARRAK